MILVAAIVALITWILWWSLKRSKHAVDELPGPRAYPIVGTTLEFLKGREAAFKAIDNQSRKYAPLYRTWHGSWPTVHLLDPRNVELILTSSEHIAKGFDYDFLLDWLGTGLLTSSGAKWHGRRKLLTPAFHFSILEQFVPVFCDKTRILVSKLDKHVGSPDGVDIVPLITRCTLDIICQTAMGTNIDAQEELNSPYVKAIYEIADLVVHRLFRPWLWPKWMFMFSQTGRRFKHCVNILHSFTLKVIRERREELTRKNDKGITQDNKDEVFGAKKRKIAFLDLLLRASQDDPTITDEDIREEVDTFMFEGHDTTAMAISWALYFLGIHSDVQARCVEELEEIFCGSDRDPNLTDLGNMKYIERVIKETLRLRPSVSLIVRKINNNLEIEHHKFPAGTKIVVQILNMHRNPDIYPDPEKFDPDRFLPENCIGRHPYAYIPFSAGPRNCIGQKFAMLEMKEVVSNVLRHFKVETIDPEKHAEPLPDLVLRPKHGVKLKLSRRLK